MRIMGLRPRESASWEESGVMRRAKRDVEDVMIDLSKCVRVRLERDVPRDTSVADITPVSSRKGC